MIFLWAVVGLVYGGITYLGYLDQKPRKEVGDDAQRRNILNRGRSDP